MTCFTLTPWTELGRDDLYDVMVLRQVVFAVEQNARSSIATASTRKRGTCSGAPLRRSSRTPVSFRPA
jgi:hypothetical protein